MKPVMSDEIHTFLAMTALGAVIVFIFDIFRCFRKVIIKKESLTLIYVKLSFLYYITLVLII